MTGSGVSNKGWMGKNKATLCIA